MTKKSNKSKDLQQELEKIISLLKFTLSIENDEEIWRATLESVVEKLEELKQ